jgi:hypothetical protein
VLSRPAATVPVKRSGAATRRQPVLRLFAIAALALVVLGCSSAGDVPPKVADVDATARELVVEWMTILQKGDKAALETFLSPAFRLVRADGTAFGKAAYVANPAKVDTYELSSAFEAAQDGPTITVHWAVEVSESFDGKPAGTAEAPRLSTFVWNDGRWRMLSHANFNKTTN